MGYDFKQILSAKDALEDNSPQVPDFMVVDYNLSDMKGIEFVERAKESDRLRKVPMMMAYNGREAGEIRGNFKSRDYRCHSFAFRFGPEYKAYSR